MPWRTCRPMDERLRFIARLLEGEKMAPLRREFGISRVTGYKIYERYKTCGLDGLNDRSRRPYRHANKLPYQVERAISPRPTSSNTSRCSTIEPDAIAISAASVPRRLKSPQTVPLTVHKTGSSPR